MNKDDYKSWLTLLPVSEREPTPQPRTRSSLYRDIDNDPERRGLADDYKVLFKNHAGFRKATLDFYCNLPIFTAPSLQRQPDGTWKTVPGIAPERMRESVLQQGRNGRAAIQTWRRREEGNRRRSWARVLLVAGVNHNDVARELGITTRGLRKLLQG